jgi:hypothetical protein
MEAELQEKYDQAITVYKEVCKRVGYSQGDDILEFSEQVQEELLDAAQNAARANCERLYSQENGQPLIFNERGNIISINYSDAILDVEKDAMLDVEKDAILDVAKA